MRPESILPRLAASVLLAAVLQPAPVAAQQMSPEDQAIYDRMVKQAGLDPAAMKAAQASVDSSRRWSEGKGGLVHYHIVGVYKSAPDVIGDVNWIGYADVTDRVEFDMDWKLDEATLVGVPSVRNFKSAVANLRNWEPKCRPPTLQGPYEHYELLAVRQGLGGALQLQVQTSYPAATVIQNCTGSGKAVPASVARRPEELVVLSPVLFDSARGGAVRVSTDRKSLISSQGGWTWTYTPSVRK
jgi:hypothetical protein